MEKIEDMNTEELEKIEKEESLRNELMGNSGKIDTYDYNYLIEAGAGAGKTHTMTYRIINQLLKGQCNPEELVAITFTEKATQEMLGRIDKQLRELLAKKPDDVKLKSLVNDIDKMQVSTIHSFCQKLLSLMPFYSDIGPGFTVMDESEAKQFASRFFNEVKKTPGEESKYQELKDITDFKVSDVKDKFLKYAQEMGNLVSPNNLTIDQRIDELLIACRSVYKELTINLGKWQLIDAAIKDDFENFSEIFDKAVLVENTPSIEDFCMCKKNNKGAKGISELLKNTGRTQIESLFADFQKECKVKPENLKDKVEKVKKLVDSNDKNGFIEAFEIAVKVYDDCKNGKIPSLSDLKKYQTSDDDISTYDAKRLFKEAKEYYEDNKFKDFVAVAGSDEDILKFFKITQGEKVTVLKDYKKIDSTNANAIIDNIKNTWYGIVYKLIYDIISPYIAEFKNLKISEKRISQNDLLFYACKMLRESKEAREYFHNRYKTIYVDEMQDTNPVQAQLLFYLTTSEGKFDATDWTKCEPEPGRLFLVGDPKQAIYRFTGADITIYNKLKNHAVFSATTKKLAFNRRSTVEICDYVNTTFKELLKSSEYQAAYDETISKNGMSNLKASVIGYGSDIDNNTTDAKKVAEIIRNMVEKGVLVGVDVRNEDKPEEFVKKKHKAQYKDFLILTSRKRDTAEYASALAENNIPFNMTGKKMYAKSSVIGRGTAVLKFLLETGNETNLVMVLNRCYGIDLPKIAAYKMLVGKVFLNSDKVKKAFNADNVNGKKYYDLYKEILAALDELQLLKYMVNTNIGMAVLEYIFDRSYACWGRQNIQKQVSDYAMTRQFLNSLKNNGYGSFYDIADKAIALADSYTERELMLDENSDCVRIMNLHKAKGLESEIVILAYAKEDNKEPKTHIVYENSDIMIYADWETRGHVDDWDKYRKIEENFKFAEKIRLLYVAATRPMSLLFICQGGKNSKKECNSYWKNLFEVSDGDKKIKQHPLVKPVFDFDEWERDSSDETKSDIADEQEIKISVDVDEINKALSKKVSDINKLSSFSISPSKLDHGTRSIVNKNIDNLVKEEQETDTANLENGNAEDIAENTSSSYEKEIETISVSDAEFMPYGSDWGTIVHRVMELLALNASYNKESIEKFSVQAILETIDINALTIDQEKALLNGKNMPQAVEYISKKVYDYLHAASIDDTNGDFRKFIKDADKMFPELPFTIFEKDSASEIAEMVVNALKSKDKELFDEEKKNAPNNELFLDMEGVMDLVIVKDDKYYILDYKTDKIGKIDKESRAETEDEYTNRLIREYTNQLNCYKKILEDRKKAVDGVYICALTIKGKLIKI